MIVSAVARGREGLALNWLCSSGTRRFPRLCASSRSTWMCGTLELLVSLKIREFRLGIR